MAEAALKAAPNVHSEIHLMADAAPAIRNGLKAAISSSSDSTTVDSLSKKTKTQKEEEHAQACIEALRNSLEKEGEPIVSEFVCNEIMLLQSSQLFCRYPCPFHIRMQLQPSRMWKP